ncbi:MAG TPA: regulatory protein RecX [Solirubrobacteraceae bacterium]|nr:regulatory protein RecX [Solirubrobacteraceae bacterium]
MVEEALTELIDAGYVDDARYARMFAQDKRALEHWGNARIRRALLARGVERDLVEEALYEADGQALYEADDLPLPGADGLAHASGELGRALALLERRFPSPPSDRRERERAMGALIRRGYDPELAVDAIAAYSRRGS